MTSIIIELLDDTAAQSSVVTETEYLQLYDGLGPSGPANLKVQATNPGLTQPGIWVQTGLGDGSDMTFWIEDGL